MFIGIIFKKQNTKIPEKALYEIKIEPKLNLFSKVKARKMERDSYQLDHLNVSIHNPKKIDIGTQTPDSHNKNICVMKLTAR